MKSIQNLLLTGGIAISSMVFSQTWTVEQTAATSLHPNSKITKRTDDKAGSYYVLHNGTIAVTYQKDLGIGDWTTGWFPNFPKAYYDSPMLWAPKNSGLFYRSSQDSRIHRIYWASNKFNHERTSFYQPHTESNLSSNGQWIFFIGNDRYVYGTRKTNGNYETKIFSEFPKAYPTGGVHWNEATSSFYYMEQATRKIKQVEYLSSNNWQGHIPADLNWGYGRMHINDNAEIFINKGDISYAFQTSPGVWKSKNIVEADSLLSNSEISWDNNCNYLYYINNKNQLKALYHDGANWTNSSVSGSSDPVPTSKLMAGEMGVSYVAKDNKIYFARPDQPCSSNGSIRKAEITNFTTEPTPNKIKVFPNPANNFIKIETEGLSRIMLYSMTGELLKKEWQEDKTTSTINLEDLPSGIYILETIQHNSHKSTTQKVIKK